MTAKVHNDTVKKKSIVKTKSSSTGKRAISKKTSAAPNKKQKVVGTTKHTSKAKKKNNKNINTIIVLVILLAIILGAAYAIFTVVLQSTKKISLIAGKLDLEIKNEVPVDGINIINATPEIASEAMAKEPKYDFDLYNKGTLTATYILYAKVPILSTLNHENVDYYLTKDDVSISGNNGLPLTNHVNYIQNSNSQISSNKKYKVKRLTNSNDEVYNVNYSKTTTSTTVYQLDGTTISSSSDVLPENAYIYVYYSTIVDNVEYYNIRYVDTNGEEQSGFIVANSFQNIYTVPMTEEEENNVTHYYALYQVDSGIISVQQVIHYTMQMWVDINAPNSQMNKWLQAQAFIVATQEIR